MSILKMELTPNKVIVKDTKLFKTKETNPNNHELELNVGVVTLVSRNIYANIGENEMVVFRQTQGSKFSYNDETYTILSYDNILATLSPEEGGAESLDKLMDVTRGIGLIPIE